MTPVNEVMTPQYFIYVPAENVRSKSNVGIWREGGGLNLEKSFCSHFECL